MMMMMMMMVAYSNHDHMLYSSYRVDVVGVGVDRCVCVCVCVNKNCYIMLITACMHTTYMTWSDSNELCIHTHEHDESCDVYCAVKNYCIVITYTL